MSGEKFHERKSYSAGIVPISVASSSFKSKTKLDLAVTSSYGNSTTVISN